MTEQVDCTPPVRYVVCAFRKSDEGLEFSFHLRGLSLSELQSIAKAPADNPLYAEWPLDCAATDRLAAVVDFKFDHSRYNYFLSAEWDAGH